MSVKHISLRLSLALLVGGSLSGTAHAQGPAAAPATAGPTNDPEVESARQHFKKGNRLFDLQRYLEAAKEYEAAYEAKDDPALLFNIGQAYRLAADYPKAIGAYKSFLRRNPGAKNRVELETRIADLQRLVAEQKRNEEATPAGTAQPTEHAAADATPVTTPAPAPRLVPFTDWNAGKKQRRAGFGLIAGGGALIVGGAVVTGLAYALQSQQSHPSKGTAFDPSAPGTLRTEQITGGVLLGVGAGAAVAGAISYYLGRKATHQERLAVAPLVGHGAMGLTLTGVLQ
jgi:hypothetical protein